MSRKVLAPFILVLVAVSSPGSAHYTGEAWMYCTTAVKFGTDIQISAWRTSITNAMSSWNSVNACNQLSLQSSGLNYISRQTDWNRNELAMTYNTVVNGEIFDSDIVMNTRYTFSTAPGSGEYDIQSVLAHELGHTLGLDHNDDTPLCPDPFNNYSYSTCATMASTLPPGTIFYRSLAAHDVLDKKNLNYD